MNVFFQGYKNAYGYTKKMLTSVKKFLIMIKGY